MRATVSRRALTVRRRLGVGAAPGLDPLRPPARIGGDLVEPAEVAVVSLVERGEALGDQSGLPERIENKPAAHDGPRQRRGEGCGKAPAALGQTPPGCLGFHPALLGQGRVQQSREQAGSVGYALAMPDQHEMSRDRGLCNRESRCLPRQSAFVPVASPLMMSASDFNELRPCDGLDRPSGVGRSS